MSPRFLLLAWMLLPWSCSEQHAVREISRTRISDEHVHDLGASTAERFGATQRPARTAPAGPRFSFATPEGWEALAPTQYRNVNMKAPGAVECYLTALVGDGGGLLANVNRWRGQLGLSSWTEADLAGLPRKPLLGQQALFVDFAGSFGGMDGSAEAKDLTLLGLLASDRGQALFVKMIGPDAAVREQAGALDEFCASLEWAAADAGAAAAAAPAAGAPGALRWTAPPHWREGAPRSMRLVTLSPEGHEDTECYIVSLPGDGGGLVDNLNRWRGQMGQRALDAAGVAGLPTISVLGSQCKLLEVTGDFQGMGGESQEDGGLLGLVCPLQGRSLFVKMVGPAPVVQAERPHFIAFCESLVF